MSRASEPRGASSAASTSTVPSSLGRCTSHARSGRTGQKGRLSLEHLKRRRADKAPPVRSHSQSYSHAPSAGRRRPAFDDARWAEWRAPVEPSQPTLASAPSAVAVRGGPARWTSACSPPDQPCTRWNRGGAHRAFFRDRPRGPTAAHRSGPPAAGVITRASGWGRVGLIHSPGTGAVGSYTSSSPLPVTTYTSPSITRTSETGALCRVAHTSCPFRGSKTARCPDSIP